MTCVRRVQKREHVAGARSGHTVLKIPVGGRQIPACVRSFPERSEAKLTLSNHLGAHIRRV